MEYATAYIPIDRRIALSAGQDLPQHTAGAALFADISGFTPLTEMLARTLGPKRGAEELTSYLNQVYDALITELHQRGGSVIGFSGDAITCWFDGDDGLLATATGLAMQAAMSRYADLEIVGGGRVTLAMKTAVVRGPVRRFVVGDPDYCLLDVMAGKTLETLAEVEHNAVSGDMVLDEATAVSLQNHLIISEWRTDAASGARFAVVAALQNEIAKRPWPPEPALPAAETRRWLLPAVYRLLQTGQGKFLAELRQTAALFLRFGGIDYDQDADAPQKLDAFMRQVQQILGRYDGSLLQLTVGDKGSYVYAAFGAPIAHEDDVDRAASAALDLQALPHQLPFLEPLQIGMTHGRMRVGAYGGAARRTYGVLGDAVNLSARLMQAAQPGQILTNDTAQARASAAFIWETLPPIRVKGKQDPIPLFQLLRLRRRRVAQPLEARFPQPIVGRQAILAQLTQTLSALSQGEGQVVRLLGAAGMGKSHLAAHLARQAQAAGVATFVGFCHSIMRNAAYTPWRQLFYDLLGFEDDNEAETIAGLATFVETQHPEWALRLPLLGDLLGLPIPDNPTTAALDSTLRQASLFSLLVEMIQSWAQQRPLLLIIDNAQWLDEASQALSQTLAQQAVGTAPVMLLLAQRPPQPGETLQPDLSQSPRFSQIIVDEMGREEIAQLAQSQINGELSPLLLEMVQRLTHGNPFFVGELLNAMQDEAQIEQQETAVWQVADKLLTPLRRANFVVQRQGTWQLKSNANLSAVKLGIPDSIHGLVLARLDRLPEANKLTLKVSSVIGQTIDLVLLTEVHPEDKLLTEVVTEVVLLEKEEVLQHEVSDEQIYAFLHHTTQEVLYETLLFTQRRQLHRAVAEAMTISSGELAPQIAPQIAHHAFAGEAWPLALRFCVLAGEQAKQLHATQQAIDFYQKALSSVAQMADVDTAVVQTQIHLALGELFASTGQYEEGKSHLQLALALAQAQADQEAEATCCRWYGRIHEQKGEYALALAWLDKGVTALNGVTALEEAELLLLSGLIHVRLGAFDRAIALCQRSLVVSEALDDTAVRARAYNLMGIIDLRSSSGDAIKRFRESLIQYEKIGNVYGQATSNNLIANGYFATGELSLADSHYRQSLDLFIQIGHVYNQVLVNNNLGGIAVKQGRLDAALGYYQRALRQLAQIQGSLWVVGALQLNMGNTFIQRGELAKAAEQLALAEDAFQQANVQDLLPELYGLFAELYGRQEAWETAVQYGQQSLQMARQLEMPREEAHNLRIMGEIALAQQQLDAAHAFFEQSQELLATAGDAYELAKTQLSLAHFYAAIKNQAAAHEMVAECRPAFQRLDAQLDVQQVDRLLALLDSASPEPFE